MPLIGFFFDWLIIDWFIDKGLEDWYHSFTFKKRYKNKKQRVTQLKRLVYQQTQHKILLWELIKPCTVFLVDIPTSLISHNHYNHYYEIFITFFCKLFDFLKKKINIKVFFLYFPPTLFLVFYKSYTYSTGLSMYLLVFLIVTLLPFFSFKKEEKISTHLKDAIPKSIGYSLFQRLVPPSPREKH